MKHVIAIAFSAAFLYLAAFSLGEKSAQKPIRHTQVESLLEGGYTETDTASLESALPDESLERLLDAIRTTESHGDCKAVSKKGAKGCYQIMDATGKNPGYGIRPLSGNSDEEHRRLARDYTKTMIDRYARMLAAASYNAGAGAVDKAIKKAIASLPKETEDYVAKVEKEYAAN